MMNNEEFERKMDFIVNQQAQFTVDIQKLQEAQKVTGKTLDEFLEGIAETKQGLVELRNLTHEGFKLTIERFDVVARNFEVITEKFNRTDDMIKTLSSNTDAKINALIDAQLRTEEKIKNTDAELDRHLTDDHNGGPKPHDP